MSRGSDFRLDLLHDALDERRLARGLSWPQVAREIGRARSLAVSTLTGLRGRSAAEADGVLQMLRWLGRSPESFVPGHPLAEGPMARLPEPPPTRILRFDTRSLYASLDEARRAHGLSWPELSRELGIGVASFQSLSRGGRTSFPSVLRLTTWLGAPAARWTVAAER